MSSRRKNRRPSLKGSLNPSKRHRDRVNVELDNLAKLLPFPPDVISKLDKLSVLRLSASYLRTKKFFNKGFKLPTNTPSEADDIEKSGMLSTMMLEALDGFLMVLTQDGEIFYASETISEFLGVSQASVIHQDFLRFVHVDDQKMLLNKLQLVPSPPEQKIQEISDDVTIEGNEKPDEDNINKERSFVCRFKCILNTNAGFFKPFKCHGRLREMDVADCDGPQYGLFLMCSPVEVSTSILEIRMKSMLFCTKNKLDLSFVDIDQKGKQIVGYSKKDILARSSYCMMHYDDVPILRSMHHQLLTTAKCQGTFRWLNKNMKWQWLHGTGQIILKNNQPDFVLTTNKPLSDEEGEEEVRRREREYGIVPTSPSNILTHLQIAGNSEPPPPPHDTTANNNQSDISGPSGAVPTTSCTSRSFSDDLPWDSATDSLFEANKVSWDTSASLSDLDEIGKGDLVGGLLHLDVNDLNFDATAIDQPPPMDSNGQDYSPTFSQHASLLMTSSQPPAVFPSSNQQPSPIRSPGQDTPPPYMYASSQHPVSKPSPSPYSTNRMSSGGDTYNVATSTTKILPPSRPPENVKNSTYPYGNQQGGAVKYTNPMAPRWSSNQQPSAYPAVVPADQNSLLRVHTDRPLSHPYIKTEASRMTTSAGYYCSEQQGLSGMLGMVGGNLSSQTGNSIYQNRQLTHAGFPAPPSPYSSACSSSSSYTDGLHVQFSPTEMMMTSPFASPRDDDYHHGNMTNPAQYYPPNGNTGYRMAQRPMHHTRVQNNLPQSFVNIAEISPVGMVDDLTTGLHHAPPPIVRNSGMANW